MGHYYTEMISEKDKTMFNKSKTKQKINMSTKELITFWIKTWKKVSEEKDVKTS